MAYPLPTEVVCDKGRELMGEVITMLNDDYNTKRKMITTRNPQANSIVKRIHKTVHPTEESVMTLTFYLCHL